MRKLITTLAIITALSAASIAPVSAAPPLTASPDCYFNLGAAEPTDPTWICIYDTDDGEKVGAAFMIGSGKSFDMTPHGPAIFFEERLEIYDTAVYEFDNGVLVTFEPGTVIFEGIDSGVVNAAASSYAGNGTVTYGSGPFAGLEGHRYHVGGPIEWYPFGAPSQSLDGILRIM